MHSAEAKLTYRKRYIDEEWRRLIPSRFPPVDIYERLGPPELGVAAKELEDKTNPRLQARAWLLDKTANLKESSPRLQNWNHAPFAYRNPEGSTFLNPAYGVLEVVKGVRPALAFALRRREVFLRRTEEPPMGLDMRLLVTRAQGEFIDLTDTPIDEDQHRRWAFGRELYEGEANGILFHLLEQPQTEALAVFDNRVLGKTVQSAHYRFIWDGKVVRKIYDFGKGEEYLREDLLAECDGREAA